MPRGLWTIFVLLGATTPVLTQLPPEIVADSYLVRAERLMAEKDYEAARDMMDKIVALQKEHDLTLPEEFHFKYARMALSAGSIQAALKSVNHYLAAAGREGEFYREALELLDQAEQKLSKLSRISAEKCAGQPKGAACWMELGNQPECYVWDDYLQPDETVTWTGECSGDLAQGTGTLTWVWDSGKETSKSTGRLQDGQRHGDWVEVHTDGDVGEGHYVEGKRHGAWVERYANGNVGEGHYVEGKRRGRWITRFTDGDVEEGLYMDGKRNGRWVRRTPETTNWTRQGDGSESRKIASVIWIGFYLGGKKHGQWEWNTAKEINRTPETTRQLKDGTIQSTAGPENEVGQINWMSESYVEGKKHGKEWKWDWRREGGRWDWRRMQTGSYVEGKKHGQWYEYGYDRDRYEGAPRVREGSYVAGKKDGIWIIYHRKDSTFRWQHLKNSDDAIVILFDNGQVVPLKPEMVTIPGERFRMGCVSGDCQDDEKPWHEVRVESFELSKYEVTFAEYDRFLVATSRDFNSVDYQGVRGNWFLSFPDSEGWGRGRHPMINISWKDAVEYTEWLSETTGERYRLPSEAEWEYAARAGTKKKKYGWGKKIGNNRANCAGCGSQWDNEKTAPVGSFGPNSWGLHNMHGNVWEWVQDCWNESYQGAPANGSAWESGDCSRRVLRGGSWSSNPRGLRSANRGRNKSGSRTNGIGFRVARTITP